MTLDPASEPDPGVQAGLAADGGEAAVRARHAEAVVERFGGIRPMASKLGVPVTTVQGWKKRGAIPSSRRAEILAAAAAHGIALTPEELDRASSATPDDPAPDGVQPSAPPQPPRPAAAFDVGRADPEPRQSSAPPSARPRGGGAVGATALLVAVVALGIAVFDLIQPGGMTSLRSQQARQTPAPDDPRLAALAAENAGLKSDIADLRDRLAALAARPEPSVTTAVEPQVLVELRAEIEALKRNPPADAAGGGEAVDLSPLADGLDRLRADLTALQARPAGADPARLAALEDALGTISGRIDALEAASARAAGPAAGPAAALAVAASQLQAALAAGTPYARELETVRALARDEPDLSAALQTLSARAATGVPAAPTLRERFGDLAGRIVTADRTRPDADWVDQTLGRVSSLVTVRRATGEVAGSGVDAVVARTQAALDRGDLADAVTEAGTLSGPAADVAGPWLADARARLAAEGAARVVADRAVSRLTGAP